MCNRKRLYIKRPKFKWNMKPGYEIVRQLGTGSYGSVCEAIEIATGEMVAIKRISGIFDNPITCKRYLREISILRRLNHPNVLKIKSILKPECLETFNELYIVLEYAPSDLKKLIKSPITLDEEQIQLILYNILCGLRYIHSANILHRDLKPANILMYNDCEVKICDFGLSRSLPQLHEFIETNHIYDDNVNHGTSAEVKPKLRRQLTKHVVTRWYRAPELILLDNNYGKPIDMWSMGCIIAEICEMKQANPYSYLNRHPLLQGESCYPLSPIPNQAQQEKEGDVIIEKSDQLKLILDLTGTPSEKEISFITDHESKKYLQSLKKREGAVLSDLYPYLSSSIVDLMESILNFDPRNRISAEEALAHNYFDNIRNPDKEKEAGFKINLEFDEEEDISLEELRFYFIRELNNFS